ncbi:Uncharacterised protein [Mycobacteroides abscessus subsp. abscessus]|nr:Uncharacterised protein [Mycobacteroides abscessus subsp. abscessus]
MIVVTSLSAASVNTGSCRRAVAGSGARRRARPTGIPVPTAAPAKTNIARSSGLGRLICNLVPASSGRRARTASKAATTCPIRSTRSIATCRGSSRAPGFSP